MFAQDDFYIQDTLREVCNQVPKPILQKSSKNKIRQFLDKLDQQHNSEDEGIQDYKIGGYHPVHIGEVLINRYVVIQKLGWGHFSTVWLCKDFKYQTYVAIKIQKSSPHYMQAALDEVQILQKVQKHYNDPKWQGKEWDDTHVVGMLNAFVHKTCYGNHFCMVFEILRCNLLDILKRYDYEGVPLDICQQMSKQILTGLDYLHRICGIIHTDLKPQNVMVCLTNQQLRQIVQNGQLQSNQLFTQRTKLIQQYMGIQMNNMQQKTQENNNNIYKIQQLQQKLKNQNLTKNQKKNLKKRIRKVKQKQNEDLGQSEQNKQIASSTDDNINKLFDIKKGKIQINRGGKLKLPIKVKIADLGNACWTHHHFSTQIQTRQYRSPQVILGQTYNQTADIWSFGCMMYEMLTGDLMFQPRKTQDWGKNDDHLAQIQQLLGKFNIDFLARSSKMRRYFNKTGKMKKFPSLNCYPLQTVLQLKNKIKPKIAKQFSQFLLPTLIAQPQKRIKACQALKNPWLLNPISETDPKMNKDQHQKLKNLFYLNQERFRVQQQKQLHDQASCEDNNSYVQQRIRNKKKQKYCDIKFVDRSFTDLGYVGYCDGIDLEQLDSCANWQFLDKQINQ